MIRLDIRNVLFQHLSAHPRSLAFRVRNAALTPESGSKTLDSHSKHLRVIRWRFIRMSDRHISCKV